MIWTRGLAMCLVAFAMGRVATSALTTWPCQPCRGVFNGSYMSCSGDGCQYGCSIFRWGTIEVSYEVCYCFPEDPTDPESTHCATKMTWVGTSGTFQCQGECDTSTVTG